MHVHLYGDWAALRKISDTGCLLGRPDNHVAFRGASAPPDLVRATVLPPTTLSGILTRCERRGELERVANPADRRSADSR